MQKEYSNGLICSPISEGSCVYKCSWRTALGSPIDKGLIEFACSNISSRSSLANSVKRGPTILPERLLPYPDENCWVVNNGIGQGEIRIIFSGTKFIAILFFYLGSDVLRGEFQEHRLVFKCKST